MLDIYKWSLEAVRKNNDGSMIWLENRHEEWVPLIASKLKLLMSGYSFLVYSDTQRRWFEKYFIQNINKKDNERPLLPFFSMRSIYPNLDKITTQEEIDLVNDMLSLSFPNGYLFFYIGRGNSQIAQIAKNQDESLMWLLNEQSQNGFFLDEKNENLDIWLLQLFKLFDKSINAILFDEVVL